MSEQQPGYRNERPAFWPDEQATIRAHDSVRDMVRAFVERALKDGRSVIEIEDLVYRYVPAAGPSLARSVLDEYDMSEKHYPADEWM